MKIKEVADALEQFAPLPLQESYDNAGLQIGLTEPEVSRVLLCLDVTEEIIREAVERGCNLIVAHHPLLFRGLHVVSDATYVERCVRLAVKNDVAVYAAHTNLDNAPCGVNFALAERLGLRHPAFLEPFTRGGFEGGSGVVGELEEPLSAEDFLQLVGRALGADVLRHNGFHDRPVSRVGLCGGAGDFLIDAALKAGCDAFLTGEMGYHRFFGLEERMLLVAAGHYETEQHVIGLLMSVLHERFPEIDAVPTHTLTNAVHHYCPQTQQQ